MKKILLVLCISTLITMQAAAQCDCQKSLVTVTGVGEVKVVPDEVSLDISVNNFDKDAASSRSEDERRTKAVISVIQNLGIDAKDYQTSYVAIDPRYKGNSDARQILGFASSSNIEVKLRDISKFAELSSNAISAGATGLDQIQFTSSKLIAHRSEARALALKAAREKALFMAEQLGQKVGRAFTISEAQNEPFRNFAYSNAVEVSAGAEPIAAGIISIREQITVSFELN
jgi:uncharacterized protein YggE